MVFDKERLVAKIDIGNLITFPSIRVSKIYHFKRFKLIFEMERINHFHFHFYFPVIQNNLGINDYQ